MICPVCWSKKQALGPPQGSWLEGSPGMLVLSALVEAQFSLPQWQERLVNLGFGIEEALRSGGWGGMLHAHHGTGMTNRK